jgi:Na+-translocating ferredoxin:NAD+ oxidoreductase RnfG subunit
MKRIVVFWPIMAMALSIFGCIQNTTAVSQAQEDPFAPSVSEAVPELDPEAEESSEIVIAVNPGPGPYTATSMGFHGIVSVTLDVDGKKLITVRAMGNDETVGLGTLALDLMPEEMIKANSIEVDVITSATHTSLAVLEAAKKALAQAGLTNEDLQR